MTKKEPYNFSDIPIWQGNGKGFAILSDQINGLIPVTRLESWKQFSELLEDNFFNQANAEFIYRGHRRFDWSLMPTLGRVNQDKSGVIKKELADLQLTHFKRAIRGRINDTQLLLNAETQEAEDELWAVGQHHGLMTPLLDWTHSPYVALFFAFAKADVKEEDENDYRAIYILNKTFIGDDDLCSTIRLYEPRTDDHGRLVNQAGLFTLSPYGSTIETEIINTLSDEGFADGLLNDAFSRFNEVGDIVTDESESDKAIAHYICKVYIKNQEREECMRHLRLMNVHHASLFPDLIGASDYCNLKVEEEWREHEIEASLTNTSVTTITPVNDEIETEVIPLNEFDQHSMPMILDLLETLAGQQVEPARLQLMAENLSQKIPSLQTVDWDKRASIQSGIRSYIRVVLRKYGYPNTLRDRAIHNIMDYLLHEAKNNQE